MWKIEVGTKVHEVFTITDPKIFQSANQFHFYIILMPVYHSVLCLNRFLNVNVIVATFQGPSLCDCETSNFAKVRFQLY